MNTSPAVEAALRAEVETLARARRRAVMKTYAAAAALMLSVGAAVWTVGQQPRVDIAAVEITTEFFPLRFSNVPAADVQLVRLEVPRAALATFGLGGGDSPPNNADATVLADVVVGSDGLARAIRFVDIEEPRP